MNDSLKLEVEEYSFTDISSIISYIQNHYIQIFMLFTVLVIIFVVDHISNINAILFSIPSPIPISLPPSQPIIHNMKNLKKNKKFYKNKK